MRYLGIALVQAWRYTFGLLTPAGHLQVPPDLLAVRDRRVPDPRPLQGRASSPAGASSAVTRGATAASTAPRTRASAAAARRSTRRDPLPPAPARVLEPAAAARAPPAARPRSGCTTRSGFSWAWSIVALTVIVRILLVPITVKQIHSMQNLQAHAPEMKALQQKWKHDKQRQNEELMKFYRENKINPAASCLPIVLQIPIFISLFYVLRHFDERRAAGLRRLASTGSHLVDITEPVKDGWGPLLLVIYVASQLSSSYFMSTTMQGAQRILLMVLPVALRPLHHQLPGRPDALLADDEPVDDRPGPRHPPADAEARAAREAELAHAREGRAAAANAASGNGSGNDAKAAARPPASPSPARRGASSARRAAEGPSDDDEITVEATGETVGEAKWTRRCASSQRRVPGLDRDAIRFQVDQRGRARPARRRLHAGVGRRDGRRARAARSPPRRHDDETSQAGARPRAARADDRSERRARDGADRRERRGARRDARRPRPRRPDRPARPDDRRAPVPRERDRPPVAGRGPAARRRRRRRVSRPPGRRRSRPPPAAPRSRQPPRATASSSSR